MSAASVEPPVVRNPAAGPRKDDTASAGADDPPSWSPLALHWRVMDFTHTVLSRGIEGTAKGIDSFFANEEALEEATQSFVKLRYDTKWFRNRGRESGLQIDARLDLPGTEDRLQLLVEQEPSSSARMDNDDSNIVPDNAVEERDDENDEDDFSVAVEGGVEGQRKKVKWQIRPAAGVLVRLEPDVFARIRTIRRQPLGRWESRFSTTLAHFYTKGVTFDATKEFDRPLTSKLTFRSRTSYGWSRRQELQKAGHAFTLFQDLTARNKVAYDVRVSADDNPQWATRSYTADIRFRRRAYRQWLFMEIVPQVQWPRSADFEPQYAALLRFEAVFGAKSLQKSRKTAKR